MPNSRFAPGSHFQSCPAASGETASGRECTTYPDTAHRCRHDRRPAHWRHDCLCRFQWITLEADALSDPDVQALVTQPRHSA